MVSNETKRTYSKNGIVTRDGAGRYAARIHVNGEDRCHRSQDKGDCERWLSFMRGELPMSEHNEEVVEAIVQMGGSNPIQVPGFSDYYITDDNELFSARSWNPVRIKIHRDRWYRLTDGEHEISVTPKKLRWCVENGVSPALLSRCKMSVVSGQSGLELIDRKDAVRRTVSGNREHEISEIVPFIEDTIKWNTILLAYYKGDTQALMTLKQMIEAKRTYLEYYVKHTLKVDSHERVAYIAEAAIEEITNRIVQRTGVISIPHLYLKQVAVGINSSIKKIRGRVLFDNDAYHIITDPSDY